ncbi:hypothetical protein A3F66_04360 [candidate division TM6 bacterium RIFCSPHIGHO2_12_FULL_32_22]|nr:MAG: hypothetical protein A3F66_04360 [candidate division TM6 bacterium RIFCSPHIGHO2_12_FULL_32_22]
MSFLPISAIVLRHIWLIKNYMNRLLFVFYWPFLDILIWGFFGKWVQTLQNNSNFEMNLLLSILLWTVCARLGMEIFNALLEELWSYNIVNIFASPITLFQWLIGVLLFVTILSIVVIFYLVIVIKLFYTVSVLALLKNFIIFAPLLFLSGISIGFLILSIIIYFGMRANEIAFVIIWSFMPFSGVFYPIENLPNWAQKISYYIPMSYIFTAMREYILDGINPLSNLVKSGILTLVYGTLFLALFFYMFNKSKNKGLTRLTD